MSDQQVISKINRRDSDRHKSCIELVNKLSYVKENPQNHQYEQISSINSRFGKLTLTKSYHTTCNELNDFIKLTENTELTFKITRPIVRYIKPKVLDGNKTLYNLY